MIGKQLIEDTHMCYFLNKILHGILEKFDTFQWWLGWSICRCAQCWSSLVPRKLDSPCSVPASSADLSRCFSCFSQGFTCGTGPWTLTWPHCPSPCCTTEVIQGCWAQAATDRRCLPGSHRQHCLQILAMMA